MSTLAGPHGTTSVRGRGLALVSLRSPYLAFLPYIFTLRSSSLTAPRPCGPPRTVQHAAGSGKQLVIAALAHLASTSFTDQAGLKFKTVLVCSDRRQLDWQLAEGIKTLVAAQKTGQARARPDEVFGAQKVDDLKRCLQMPLNGECE